MAFLGGGTLAWQSDYSQFYLVDATDPLFQAPVEISPEMMQRRWYRMPSGLVVYTHDSLQQLIDIRLFDAEAPQDAKDWRSGKTWTQIETTRADFPSRQCTVSSPSRSGGESYGPIFRCPSVTCTVRISWMEFEGPRDDSKPVQPDVIRLDLWPSAG